jgi:uncharacterized protein
MRYEQAVSYARERLQSELPPHLHYHGATHTSNDVVPAVSRLAEMEGIQGEPLHLLMTAAWYHDIGYVERPVHHELLGARIAREVLPTFKYTPRQVEAINWAILATALPQSPQNHLEQILCDADLDVLGREDFWPRNRALRRELAELGKEFTDAQWYAGQLKFIEPHAYFTASARTLRDDGKALHVQELRQALQQAEAGD